MLTLHIACWDLVLNNEMREKGKQELRYEGKENQGTAPQTSKELCMVDKAFSPTPICGCVQSELNLIGWL